MSPGSLAVVGLCLCHCQGQRARCCLGLLSIGTLWGQSQSPHDGTLMNPGFLHSTFKIHGHTRKYRFTIHVGYVWGTLGYMCTHRIRMSPTSCRLKSAHMKFHKSSHRSFMSKPRHYCRMRCTRFKSERSQPSRGFFAGGGAPAAGARSTGLEFHLAAYRLMSNLRLHPS